MKRMLSGLIALMLCLLLVSAPAFAESANKAYLQTILDGLDARGFEYTLNSFDDSDGYYAFYISIDCDYTTYEMRVWIGKDEDTGTPIAHIEVKNIITYDAARVDEVKASCNVLNYDCYFARYYVTTFDTAVALFSEIPFAPDSVGEIVPFVIESIASNINSNYYRISRYIK